MKELRLPMPISTNAMYRNVPKVGRVKTTVYKQWIRQAGLELNLQRPEKFDGDVGVEIVFGPRNKRRDIDNCIKPVLDLLQKHGVIKNDNQVVKVSAAWGDVDGAVVRVNGLL
jgi:Holliday junction resolvase RusA-like endonuclease